VLTRVVRLAGPALPWLVAAVSFGIGLAITRPFVDVPVSFDTQATVVYFERVIHGARLESPLSTTPKPLLTVIFGAAHALTGDWRLIVWLTIAAQAAAAGLAVVLGRRAAGAVVGVTAGLMIAGTSSLIEEAAFGSAVPWALLGWFIAGALLTGPRTRPGLAGVALALAALCRLETLVIVAIVGAALGWARYGPWPPQVPRPVVPGRLWLAVVVPFASLPAMLLHDWLLTGDPYYWIKVSERYSDAVRAAGTILGPAERVRWFVHRYVDQLPAVMLGLIGAAALVRDRRWGVLVGLFAMGPGIAWFIVLLAVRDLFAPERYAIPVDLALFLLAAFGFGRIIDVAHRVTSRSPALRPMLTASAFSVGLAAVAGIGTGPFDQVTVGRITDLRILNENTARIIPWLRAPEGAPASQSPIRWIVPTAVRPRVTVDLGVPLTSAAGLSLAWIDPATSPLHAGQIIFHDLRGDKPRGQYGAIEGGRAVQVGSFTLRPLLVSESTGAWLYVAVTGP